MIPGEQRGAQRAHETLTSSPSRSLSVPTIARLRATPPVNVTSSSIPTRRKRPAERAAIDW
jgi:hypothetical protein